MSEETRRDPAVWVLLPSDPGDLQYDMEPLVACLNEEAAKEHREADERVVRYVPEDTYREQVWRERFEVLTAQRDAALAVVAQARNVSPRICGAAGVLAEKVKAYDTVVADAAPPLRPLADEFAKAGGAPPPIAAQPMAPVTSKNRMGNVLRDAADDLRDDWPWYADAVLVMYNGLHTLAVRGGPDSYEARAILDHAERVGRGAE